MVWRFEARDLRTRTLLAHDLPLGSVRWGQRFDGKALTTELTARIDLAEKAPTTTLPHVTWGDDPATWGPEALWWGDPAYGSVQLSAGFLAATRPVRTVIWVYRDEQLLDGLIVWQRTKPLGSSRFIELRCLGLLSYFARRILTVTKTYTAVDQSDIARDLINFAQAQPGGNIGLAVPGSPDSGVLRNRQPLAWSYERKNIGQLVAQLADVIGGFEYAVEYTVVADAPVATFTIHYPERGRAANSIVLLRSGDGSGNLWDYGLDEGGDGFVTTVHGIGAGEGDAMLLATQSDTSLIDQGYPLLEDYVAHKDISQAATLIGHAQERVRQRGRVNETWELLVDPDDVSTPFGSWIVGDRARVVIEDDDRFPAGPNGEPGLDTTVRIIGQSVQIPDDGGPDRVTLDAEVPVG